MRKPILLVVESLALTGSLYWVYTQPKIESFIAVFTSLAVLVGTLFFTKKKDEKSETKAIFKQKAGKKSKQYMSRGNMDIGKDN